MDAAAGLRPPPPERPPPWPWARRPPPTFWRQADKLPGNLVVPFGRHLAWGANPRTQMRVGWQVPHPVRAPFVRVGDSPWNLGHPIPAEIRDLHSALPGAIAPVDQYYLHAALDNLLPGRRYYYAVGHDGYEPPRAKYGRVDTFTTAPTRRRVPGRSPSPRSATRASATTRWPTTGWSRPSARRSTCTPATSATPTRAGARRTAPTSTTPRTWDQFLAQTEPVAARAVDGRRSATTTWRRSTRPTATAASGPGGTSRTTGRPRSTGAYSFVYGNVGVVALDANDVSYEIPANHGYTGGAQTTGWTAG